MSKMYKAKVLRDTSETEYTTVYEKIHATEKEAKEAIKNIFGHVKTVKPVDCVIEINKNKTV